MADLEGMSAALQKGDRKTVTTLVTEALDEGVSPKKILEEGLISGMNIIGAKFKNNEVYVPEVLIAARAMQGGLEILEPKLAETGVEPTGRIIIGTVKGDLHDIGKNLVGMMLKGGGFAVDDLGTDVDAQKFIESVKSTGKCVVALSALLTTTMPQMAEVVKALKEAGLDEAKVMIGGAPVTQNYADEIGADGYAPDAASAVDTAKSLLG
ncbi:MAG: cobalamin-binding protein [Anaerolineaceae bacterium]|nr:cobalamin-binding protein [Anaerolineaceae bacterium]